jgi:hypothetical protein
MLMALGLFLLWEISVQQDSIYDFSDMVHLKDAPIIRFMNYGRDMNLFRDRMGDSEIEFLIRRRTWNPRLSKPHHPWNECLFI